MVNVNHIEEPLFNEKKKNQDIIFCKRSLTRGVNMNNSE